MSIKNMRREILQKVADGRLSAEDGNRLLGAIEEMQGSPEMLASGEQEQSSETVPPENPPHASSDMPASDPDDYLQKRVHAWQRWWLLPFGVGVLLTVLGAWWMYDGMTSAGLGWGFWLAWFPFLLGLALMILGFFSRSMPWLFIKVHEVNEDGGEDNVNLMFPLPIGLAGWGLRTFGHHLPEEARQVDIAGMLETFEANRDQDAPLMVVVDEENTHVEIALVNPAAPAARAKTV